jgi:hypothetical protein
MLRSFQRFRAAPAVAAAAVVAACSGAGAEGGPEREAVESARAPRVLMAPAGRVITLASRDSITSRRNRVGDPVRAAVLAAVTGERGETVIPEGAVFHGAVTAIAPAEQPGEPGTLSLRFTRVVIAGRSHPVEARVVSMATVMAGRGVTAGDAAKVGAGAVAGGIAGRIIGGNKTGTLVGAAAGAAGGFAYAHATRDVDIVLPRGARLRLELTQPLSREASPRPVS